MASWVSACGGAVVATLVCAALGACASSRAPDAAPPPSGAPNAVSRVGCGPTDGAATQVDVFAGPASCDAFQANAPKAHLGIWSGMISAGGHYVLEGSAGHARICPTGDDRSCKETRAELRVTAMGNGSWSGELTWSDASGPQRMAFTALDCPSQHEMCG